MKNPKAIFRGWAATSSAYRDAPVRISGGSGAGFRPAFTLVDMLIALAILAVVLSSVYAVFSFQQKALNIAQSSADVFGQAQVILDRLSRDLSGTWLPGVKTMGTRAFGFDAGAGTLDFVSTSALASDADSHIDLVEIGYRVVAAEDAGDESLLLVRRQDNTLDDDFRSGGFEIILTRDLVSLEILYGQEAVDSRQVWSAEMARDLPRLVMIKLVMAAGDQQTETFLATVIVPLAQEEIRAPATLRGQPLS